MLCVLYTKDKINSRRSILKLRYNKAQKEGFVMKKYLSVMSVICALAIGFCALGLGGGANPAQNVVAFDPNLPAIEALQVEGVFEGFEDGELHPERCLTRAQFAKILTKAFPDFPHNEVLFDFSDIDKTHWAFEYVQIAANSGWLNGFPDGTFRPDDNITYEQAMAIVSRILDIAPYNASYPADYVAAAIEYSVSDGLNCLIGDELNRGEAARVVVNAISSQNGQISRDDSYNSSALFGAPMGAISSGSGLVADQAATVEKTAGFASASGAMGGGSSANIVIPEEYYPPMSDSEEYTKNDENVFKNVLTSPLSTFSIDTDTASYSNLRRFILNGQPIPEGSVRSEELINYFDYAKAQTTEGVPFGVEHTVAPCPWNKNNLLAMLTVSGEELAEPAPSNLVFLIDVSGSMYSRNKLPLVKQSLSLLLNKLGEKDTISIVTYASGTGVALEPTPATDKEKIMAVIDSLRSGGGTAGAGGITLAYEQAEKHKVEGNNRIILCTDGDFNIGISSSGDLEALITEKREKGIFLSVLGFGMGNYKDSKMELLADKGNGNYAYIDTLREAKKVLVDEMPKTIYTIAKDVKIQVEFNPKYASAYRLIGYENRVLNDEDFENDKKDAGELGAGATVTVLYEIVPANGNETSGLKYQTSETVDSDELMTVSIRYKKPDSDESTLQTYPIAYQVSEELSEDFCFASAVAELGMILNKSEYVGSSTYDSVIELAKKGLGSDEYAIRGEFLQLVDLLRYRIDN